MLLVPTLGDTTLGLTALLVAVPAASGLLGVVVIRLATPPRDRGGLFPVPDEARPALRYATVNYLGMLLAQGPQFTVPLIVSAVVAAEEASAFAVAWLICSVLFLIPHTVGQVLLAESSRAPGEVSTQVRTGLTLTAPTMALAAGATVAIGPAFVAFVFGDTYELTGDILATIVGAGVPWAFTAILLARARVLGHNGVGVVITGAFAVSTLGLVALSVGDGGVEAAADAWLAGNVIAALVAVGVTVATRSSGRAEVVASPEPA
jgi:O-antigen/teichoic acid export membrane protein